MTLTAAVRRGSDFSLLSRQVRDARLLDRRRVQYSVRIGLTLLAYAATWVTFAAVGHSWWQLVTAVVMGITYTQVAFLGHDGGHQQVWRSKKANDLLGIFAGDLLTGLSYGWWIDKHNRHHAKPNHEGSDPDIAEGVLAFTTGQAANRNNAFARFITRNQAYLFFPLLAFEGLNLHVSSIISLGHAEHHKRRKLEISLYIIHLVAFFGALLYVLGPVQALAFFAVQKAVFGIYMGCSFAPNHKGMPIIAPGVKMDFLRRQVLTSRNIRGGRFTDFVLGGLNYQIEHHLFPNMPTVAGQPAPRPGPGALVLRRAQHPLHRDDVARLVRRGAAGAARSRPAAARREDRVGIA